jgi:hypothetical protein
VYHDNAAKGKRVPSTIQEFALDYVERTWNPVPVDFRGKKPSAGDEWQHVKIDATNVAQYFNGRPQNIGVQLGSASSNLVDVDLDCPEALALGPHLLPQTNAIFGRPSTPAAHRLYYVESVDGYGVRANFPFNDPRGAAMRPSFLNCASVRVERLRKPYSLRACTGKPES